MIPKPVNSITKSDIDQLIENGVNESKTLEYKQTLPGSTDKDKKEFLADVSSFANASGGDIVYGVAESDGVAASACGLVECNKDNELLRLESIIRDGISPRLPGIQMEFVGGFPNGPVMVLRVPKSWQGPHMVTFKGSSRFYFRNGASKSQMDVTEIRSAFQGSGDLANRIRDWRNDRLSQIISDEGPVRLVTPDCLVFHLVPFESFNDPWRFTMKELTIPITPFCPMGEHGWNPRINLDGHMSFTPDATRKSATSYTQVFRSGRIESVLSNALTDESGVSYLASKWYERAIVEAVQSHLKGLNLLDVHPPIVFMLSILNAKGAFLSPPERHLATLKSPIDRNLLIIPDVLFEDFDCDVPQVLRPAFDAVWNACDYPRSFNYDEDGKWNPDR